MSALARSGKVESFEIESPTMLPAPLAISSQKIFTSGLRLRGVGTKLGQYLTAGDLVVKTSTLETAEVAGVLDNENVLLKSAFASDIPTELDGSGSQDLTIARRGVYVSIDIQSEDGNTFNVNGIVHKGPLKLITRDFGLGPFVIDPLSHTLSLICIR